VERVVASFEAIPVTGGEFDVVVFNAALHYAEDLGAALREARRVTRVGGRVVVLDSPFYRSAEHGEAMVREKRRQRRAPVRESGADAPRARIHRVSHAAAPRRRVARRRLGPWRRRRVRYPLWYELRGVRALVRGERTPSRFDLWESVAT
jgi:SAM-dependent methyltransferase